MKSFDLVIIGGGICGMTAAIYAARANIRACILEQQVCGGHDRAAGLDSKAVSDFLPVFVEEIAAHDSFQQKRNDCRPFPLADQEFTLVQVQRNAGLYERFYQRRIG